MTLRYIDAHCHIQFPEYDTDREHIIAQMAEQGIAGVVVGCDTESSQAAVALVEKHDNLFASVGQHPNHAGVFDEDKMRELLTHESTVAVGECGLDYFRPSEVTDAVKDAQKELFKHHVALAAEFDKPLIIHARPSKGTMDAYQDLIVLLRDAKKTAPGLRGDVHFFVGGIEEAQAFIELGFTVSFTAVVTFARDYDGVIRSVPLARILVETDAPYVAPASRRGTRNDSLALPEIIEKLALVRGEDSAVVREQILTNTKELFRINA